MSAREIARALVRGLVRSSVNGRDRNATTIPLGDVNNDFTGTNNSYAGTPNDTVTP